MQSLTIKMITTAEKYTCLLDYMTLASSALT